MGNDAITTKDFESSIAVNFGDVAKILSVEISEKSPKDLEANVSYSDNSVELKPLLLNESDSVTIKVLVSKPQEAIIFSGRIAGVKKIEERDERNQSNSFTLRVAKVLFASVAIMVPFIAIALGFEGRWKNLGLHWIPDLAKIFIAICLGILFILGIWAKIKDVIKEIRSDIRR